MTDVFISYAREDRPFVQRLHDALARSGHGAWVDWEGIPASAKWMAEVRSAIDEAECFCFVVSPDSVESPVCREEAAHAAASNKRILPLLHREVPDGLVPETVAAHNWIEFHDPEDFDRAFETLVRALQTEPEHLRTHTRLLVRGKEWEAAGRDRGSLLRGHDLTSAEAWLGSAQGKEPAPAQLHTAYVLASRKAASRRQRTTIGAVALALVVSLVLSAVALVQRGEAQQQARAANSRALAAQSLVHMDRDLDLAILLGLEAYRTSPTDEAVNVLHIAAQRSSMIDRMLATSGAGGTKFSPGGRNAVAYSPDGRLIAAGSTDGRVSVWDAESGEPIGRPFRADAEAIHAIAFSPDGTYLAAGGEGGTVTFWDPGTSSEASPSTQVEGAVTSIAIHRDARSLAVGTAQGKASLVTIDGSTIAEPVSFGSGEFKTISGLAFAPDGGSLAVAVESGQLSIVHPRTLEVRDELDANALAVWGPEFSPDGRTLAAGILTRTAGDGAVLLWDVGSARLVQRLRGHTDQVFDVSYSAGGRVLASASADATVRLWDLASGEQIGDPLVGHPDDVHALAFDPSGRDLISASADGSVIVWDAGARLVAGGGPVNVVTFTGDGERLISAEPFSYAEPFPPDPAFDGGGDVFRWDVTTWTPLGPPIQGEYIYGLAAAPHGGWFAGGAVDGQVLRWPSESSNAPMDVFRGAGDIVFGLAITPDGRTIAGGTFGSVHLWDVATGEELREPLRGPDEGTYALAFSPDGETLVTGGWDGRVLRWDTATWERVGDPLADGLLRVYAATFDPSGATLAAAGYDGRVIMWDTSDWRRIRQVTIENAILSLAFSPDGRVLAAGTEAGEVEFLDVGTGQRIGGPVAGQRDWVNTIAFDPGGDTVVAGSEDGSIAIIGESAWTDDVGVLSEKLCRVTGRDLSREEWNEFVPFRRYEPGCPRLDAP